MHSTEFILELDKLFKKKDWDSKENYDQVFNSLASIGTYLIEKKTDPSLILELLDRFHWISLNDYYEKCRELLIQIIEDLPPRIFNIYAFPIIKERHQYKIKSGSFLIYLIKSILPTIPGAEKLNFEDISNFTDLKKLKFTKSDIFILADDFIGGGESFGECTKKIRSINSKIFDRLYVLSLAIRKSTLDELAIDYKVYHKYEVLKAITDFNTIEEAEVKKDSMRQIENKLFNSINKYSLGYEESESVITLLRTPDNTFPIFWHKFKKRVNLNPPFPRYEKAK